MYKSIVEYFQDKSGGKCGYCRSRMGSYSHGMWGHVLTCQDYQELIDRGWRRSGQNLSILAPNFSLFGPKFVHFGPKFAHFGSKFAHFSPKFAHFPKNLPILVPNLPIFPKICHFWSQISPFSPIFAFFGPKFTQICQFQVATVTNPPWTRHVVPNTPSNVTPPNSS